MRRLTTILLAILFSFILFIPKTAYANELPSLWVPAQVILGSFALLIATLPGDLGTVGYRFVMLSPLATVMTGASTVVWGGIRWVLYKQNLKH